MRETVQHNEISFSFYSLIPRDDRIYVDIWFLKPGTSAGSINATGSDFQIVNGQCVWLDLHRCVLVSWTVFYGHFLWDRCLTRNHFVYKGNDAANYGEHLRDIERFFSLKPGLGQNIDLYALLTTNNSTFLCLSSSVFSFVLPFLSFVVIVVCFSNIIWVARLCRILKGLFILCTHVSKHVLIGKIQ